MASNNEQRRELIEAARNATVEELSGGLHLCCHDDGCGECDGDVMDAIREGFDAGYDFALSPSVVHRIERAWVPVSERFPEVVVRERFLVQYQVGSIREVDILQRWEHGDWEDQEGNPLPKGVKVEAWMPIPPYEAMDAELKEDVKDA